MEISPVLKKLFIGRTFTNERGRIKLFGKMDWTFYESRWFAYFLQKTGERLGPDFLFNLGYKNGRLNAEEMVASMKIKPSGGWITQNAIIELLDFLGYGKLKFIVSKTSPGGHHHFIMQMKDNPTVEKAIKMYGKNSRVCYFFDGIFSGHGEIEMGLKNVHIRENKCLSRGDPYCEWETKW